MKSYVWSLISISLISVKAVTIYEQPQSSSEAPLYRSASPEAGASAPTEILLNLTPDQVEALKQAGAKVRPFPEYEGQFAQQEENYNQFKQQYREQNKQAQFYNQNNYQILFSDLASIKNDDSSQEQVQAQKPNTDSRRNQYIQIVYYNVSSPARQQKEEYSQYLTKNSNADNANLKTNNLKTKPYTSQYRWKWQTKDKSTVDPAISALDVLKAQIKTDVREPEQLVGLAKVTPQLFNEESWISKLQNTPKSFERTQNTNKVPDNQKNKKSEPHILDENKLKSLLLPLLSQQKEELLRNEKAIQNKLKNLKETAIHDGKLYSLELSKLKDNLGQQNALEKLLVEAVAKAKSAEQENQKGEQPLTKSVAYVKLPVFTASAPKPSYTDEALHNAVPLQIVRTVESTYLKPRKVELKTTVKNEVPSSLTKNVYLPLNKPYSVPTIQSGRVNNDNDESSEEVSDIRLKKPIIVHHIWKN